MPKNSKEVEETLAHRDMWVAFGEKFGWSLYGFTYDQSASFRVFYPSARSMNEHYFIHEVSKQTRLDMEAALDAVNKQLQIEIENRDLALKHRKELLEERDNVRNQVLEELALLHEEIAIFNNKEHVRTIETSNHQREWARLIRSMKGKKNVSWTP